MTRAIATMAIGVTLTFSATKALAQDESGGAAAAVSTDDAGGKIHLGVRAGYGIPLGNAQGGGTDTVGGVTVTTEESPLSDAYTGMIPIWLDLGYFVTPNIMLGVYGHYGIGLVKEADPGVSGGCPSGADCSGSVIRFGVQGQYHLSPGESVNPWFGLGVGYEIASISASAGGVEGSQTVSGFEFANLQAGADFKVADNVGIGPFVSFSLGQYSSVSMDPEIPGMVDEIPNKAIHEWLVIGAKGSFNF